MKQETVPHYYSLYNSWILNENWDDSDLDTINSHHLTVHCMINILLHMAGFTKPHEDWDFKRDFPTEYVILKHNYRIFNTLKIMMYG